MSRKLATLIKDSNVPGKYKRVAEAYEAAISELLKPYNANLMRCYPVSSRVNHVANDDEECSRPVEIADPQNRLFV